MIERSRELPVVVDFWAAWCGPCRALGPALDAEADKRAGQLELVKLNVDAEPQIAARYGIQSIPTSRAPPAGRSPPSTRSTHRQPPPANRDRAPE